MTIQSQEFARAEPVPALGHTGSFGGSRPVRDWSERAENSVYRRFAKRAFDTVLILLALPLVLPLVALMALLVRLDGGPAFYTQDRVGLGGRTFRIWKLRSMVPDAQSCLDSYLASDPAARAEWETKQKLIHDPRITRVGQILRKTSMDELPQLWNVLVGDMSLVGPRPMMVSQKDLYPGRSYFELRPGITGLWQISDRNECAFSDRARFDNIYNRVLSPATDAAILLRTVSVVLRATGR